MKEYGGNGYCKQCFQTCIFLWKIFEWNEFFIQKNLSSQKEKFFIQKILEKRFASFYKEIETPK